MNTFRGILCWIMVATLPALLMASDGAIGMARPYGAAWLNGVELQQPLSVFTGDLMQTGSSGALKMTSPGSSVTVLSDSVAKLEMGIVNVDHGSVKIASSKALAARADIVTATPTSNTLTEFSLSHLNGVIRVVALKGDLLLTDGEKTTVLEQGQQATQADSGEQAKKPNDVTPVPAAKSRKKAFIIIAASGAGVAAVGTAVALEVNTSGSPRVISPVTP